MSDKQFLLNMDESRLLHEIERGEWQEQPLDARELERLREHARYTKSLHEKKQTTIRFSASDLAVVKARSKELGIGYQNLIQALVHNYAIGKIKLEL
ncbi:MAG: hypothetical protein GX665_11835 [Gammaproteobacteria bacterium]|nr:hypothetical protein [Gammaproteobacteria bacterium]